MDRQPPIHPDFVLPKAEKDKRAAENSSEYPCDHRPCSNSLYIDLENWNWNCQSDWDPELADEKWQAFNDLWYGNEDSQFDDPSLSLDAGVIEAPTQTIIVRPSYVIMFDHVYAQVFRYSRPQNGVLITGQPGTGVSYFPAFTFKIVKLSLKARPYFSITSLLGFCSLNKSCSSPYTPTIRCSSTIVKFICVNRVIL